MTWRDPQRGDPIMPIYRVGVKKIGEADSQARYTATFSDFGDANRWAMGVLRNGGVYAEAWVVASGNTRLFTKFCDRTGL